MELTDNDLMLAVKRGKPECFGVLFDRHQRRLFEFFYRLSGDAASSEDLVQEVFLRMLKYRNTFREDSNFRPWMYHIARTARVDRFNAERDKPSPPGFTELAPIHHGEEPLQRLLQNERSHILQQALLQLPEAKRELLILARFHELKYEDIASLLNVETSTIKVRVHRALIELREIIQRLSEVGPCVVKKSGE